MPGQPKPMAVSCGAFPRPVPGHAPSSGKLPAGIPDSAQSTFSAPANITPAGFLHPAKLFARITTIFRIHTAPGRLRPALSRVWQPTGQHGKRMPRRARIRLFYFDTRTARIIHIPSLCNISRKMLHPFASFLQHRYDQNHLFLHVPSETQKIPAGSMPQRHRPCGDLPIPIAL